MSSVDYVNLEKPAVDALLEAKGIRPLDCPNGDEHHTERPFTEEDNDLGHIAHYLGTLSNDENGDNFAFGELSSWDQWRRVARALRIHGLRIATL